jgi:Uma2 family endonuclease
MSIERKRFYTLDEYFKLERDSRERYEYWHGEVFNMSGASPEHDDIVMNVGRTLGNLLASRPCRVSSSDMKIKVPAAPPYRYADIVITCGNREFEEIGGMKMLINPTLIIEVLSPSTERYDRGAKFTNYQSISSFKEYLLIAQDKPCITQFVKQEDGNWKPDELTELSGKLYLPSIDCTLALNDVYQDINFE